MPVQLRLQDSTKASDTRATITSRVSLAWANELNWTEIATCQCSSVQFSCVAWTVQSKQAGGSVCCISVHSAKCTEQLQFSSVQFSSVQFSSVQFSSVQFTVQFSSVHSSVHSSVVACVHAFRNPHEADGRTDWQTSKVHNVPYLDDCKVSIRPSSLRTVCIQNLVMGAV